MCGWLPIFDTMNGVRGEVNVQVISWIIFSICVKEMLF
jgi:hypothetical protein